MHLRTLSARLLAPVFFALSAAAALAGEAPPPFISVDDWTLAEFTPAYSDQLGAGFRAAAGAYVSPQAALGVIVEYGENRRSLSGAAGLQLTDVLSLVGSAGQMREDITFADDPEAAIRQNEYTLSLIGDLGTGPLQSLALSGHLSDASSGAQTITTGKAYGFELTSRLALDSATSLEAGAGYSWLKWDDGTGNARGLGYSLEALRRINDMVSLTGGVGSLAGERSYTGGLMFDLAQGGRDTSTLRIGYTFTDGRKGLRNDRQIGVCWTVGFGAGKPSSLIASKPGQPPRLFGKDGYKGLLTRILNTRAPVHSAIAKQKAASGASCGNGILETGEACDDGNTDNTDSCSNSCTSASCGDGIVQTGEACDDGNTTDNDSCSNSCASAACGDGIVQTGEACDDGNTTDDDSCSNSCAAPTCGDGIVQSGEACDDGNNSNTDSCLNTCMASACGDGFVRTGVEQCDDGNNSNTDACLNTCSVSTCGDGFVQVGVEQCDDGNSVNTDACLNTCWASSCGDGFVRAGVEQCDDGNSSNNDSCLNSCVAASCGDGFVSGFEQCDDGNSSNSDSCTTACQLPVCGDGILTGSETCDDGNTTSGDGCDATCSVESY